MHDDPRPGSIPAASAALTACLAAVDRVIEQNDGHVAAGVDWHALRGSILRGRAALAAPKAEAWQPIATAPKNGTHVLVIVMTSKEPRADIAHWNEGEWRAGTDDCWDDARGKGGEVLGYYADATHWMPLPAPPTSPAPQEES